MSEVKCVKCLSESVFLSRNIAVEKYLNMNLKHSSKFKDVEFIPTWKSLASYIIHDIPNTIF